MKNKIKVAYFCLTPYQIINAIVLTKTNINEKADLYINIELKNAKQIKNNLQKINIFNKIIIINEKIYWNTNNNNIYNTFVKIFNYIRAKKIVKNITNNVFYNKVYLYSKNRSGMLVYLTMNKYGNCELAYYEDGIGSYYNKNLYTLRYRDYLLRKVLFNTSNDLNQIPLYVYSPELYRNIGIMPFSNIKKIPSFNIHLELKPLLNIIFDYKKNDLFKENIIIIDAKKENILNDENQTKAFKIYDYINQELSFYGVIIKKHPSDKTNNKLKIKEFEKNDIPFEIFCLNNNLSNKVLITIASSAVFTPKLLFNQEPYLVLLHNLFSFKNGYGCESFKLIDFVYQKCKNLYRSKNKIFIPNSLKELKDCIDIIKNNLLEQ